MSKIVDQNGNPLQLATLEEPQTASVAATENRYLTNMLSGLTPSRLARTLQAADDGSLADQHRLFSDMEERDPQIQAEMAKRKNAILTIPWDIVPPRNPTPAEKAATEWVKEALQDAVDPIEDLFLAMMDAPGHGFAAIELEWRREGKEWLPGFNPRPQDWFQMDSKRKRLTLTDGSVDGADLNPFGWIMHTPGKAKTGYGARLGLYRTLVWPFLYKSYALGDFAEFLETYGLPIIIGKYFAGASPEERASLMRAVTQLGHDARAIMPKEMELEIAKITSGGGENAHLQMMCWADAAISKSILGQTLSSDVGKGGGGSYALGKVHNAVREDIRDGDARNLGATATRDLVYPMVALNRSGVDGLHRSPRLVFPKSEVEDVAKLADALPRLVAVGYRIPRAWAQQKAAIPEPKDGEPVLTVAAPAPQPTAALSAVVAASSAPQPMAAPMQTEVDQLDAAAAPSWAATVERLRSLVEGASSLPALQEDLLLAFGTAAPDDLVKIMASALALAELKGMADVRDGA